MTQTFSGKLEVICGSMFSGKSEELMSRLRRAEYAKKSVLTIKHQIDNRKSFSCIVSHNGAEREAHPIGTCEDGLIALQEFAGGDFDVIGIDEIQFFDNAIVDICNEMANRGQRVIVAGLDMDSNGKPFGPVPYLLAIAEFITKLHAVCEVSGELASYSFRLEDSDETILVGAKDKYQARSRSIFYGI